MFTGIIETMGKVLAVSEQGSNKTFLIQSDISTSLKVDQSVSHNGVCLTVEATANDTHSVTAIAETLSKTELNDWKPGTLVNLERCMHMNGRVDGHLVSGHVDMTGTCIKVESQDGSWLYRFSIPPTFSNLIIEKGSICLNGISLTLFDVANDAFSVAIIPYTYEHTNIHGIKEGSLVNIEFDLIGKYIARNLSVVNKD